MEPTEKVLAYVTRRGGSELLLFSHLRVPAAGLQVPGGTLEPGESPAVGALREVQEETGLNNLGQPHLLGMCLFHPPAGGRPQRRHVYHVPVVGETPDAWKHAELTPSVVGPEDELLPDGSTAPIPLAFFWVPLSEPVPPLAGERDALLDALRAHLANRL